MVASKSSPSDRSFFATLRMAVSPGEKICWVLFFGVLVMFVWASGRGFDFTDEGFYYLRTENPSDDLTSNTLFGSLAHLFLKAVDGRVWGMRLVSVTLHAMAGVVLCWGWSAWRNTPVTRRSLIPCLALASLAGLGQIAPALSYKTLTGLGCTLWLGVWLRLQANSAALTGARRVGLLAALVAAASVAFFGKPPSAACLLLFSIPTFVPDTWRDATLRAFAFAALLGLALVTLFGAMQRWGIWDLRTLFPQVIDGSLQTSVTRTVGQYLNGRFFASLAVHTGNTLLHFFDNLFYVGWPLLTGAFVGLLRQWWQPQKGFIVGFFTAMVALGAWQTVLLSQFIHLDYHHWSGELLPPFVAAMAVSGWMLQWTWSGVRPDFTPQGVVVALVPLFGWLGAHNSMGFECIFQLSPWAALACLAWNSSENGRPVGLPSQTVPTVLSALFAMHLWMGVVEAPYRQGKPLYAQTKELTFSAKRQSHLMDGKTGSMVNQAKSLLRDAGFERGDPVLAFYNLPGLVYAVGGRSPGLAWYRDPETNFLHEGMGTDVRQRTREALLALKEDVLKRAFIVQTTDSVTFVPILAERGIRFPEDYRKLGTIPKPPQLGAGELTLWAPAGVKPLSKP